MQRHISNENSTRIKIPVAAVPCLLGSILLDVWQHEQNRNGICPILSKMIATQMETEITTTTSEEKKAKTLTTPSGIILKPNSLRIALPVENQSGETMLRLIYFDGKEVFIRNPQHVEEVQTALNEYYNS